MNRAEWEAIAKALGDLRRKVAHSWPPKGGYITNAPDVHDRKLIWGASLAAVDDVARSICGVLKGRSSRFDSDRFLRIVGVDRKT